MSIGINECIASHAWVCDTYPRIRFTGNQVEIETALKALVDEPCIRWYLMANQKKKSVHSPNIECASR